MPSSVAHWKKRHGLPLAHVPRAGADPGSKVRGGAISVYLVVKYHTMAKVVLPTYSK